MDNDHHEDSELQIVFLDDHLNKPKLNFRNKILFKPFYLFAFKLIEAKIDLPWKNLNISLTCFTSTRTGIVHIQFLDGHQ